MIYDYTSTLQKLTEVSILLSKKTVTNTIKLTYTEQFRHKYCDVKKLIRHDSYSYLNKNLSR